MVDANPTHDFEYERRFLLREVPQDIAQTETPTLIVQSYFVHEHNYSVRVRLKTDAVRVAMTPQTDALDVIDQYADAFQSAVITVKGPSVGGTRYEAEREIDLRVALELVKRAGDRIVKNRYHAWIDHDGWSIDEFGGANYPLVIAEAERAKPVTNLAIPSFCVTEITDERRFSNDELSYKPFSTWRDEYEAEIRRTGPHFAQIFGKNRKADE